MRDFARISRSTSRSWKIRPALEGKDCCDTRAENPDYQGPVWCVVCFVSWKQRITALSFISAYVLCSIVRSIEFLCTPNIAGQISDWHEAILLSIKAHSQGKESPRSSVLRVRAIALVNILDCRVYFKLSWLLLLCDVPVIPGIALEHKAGEALSHYFTCNPLYLA